MNYTMMKKSFLFPLFKTLRHQSGIYINICENKYVTALVKVNKILFICSGPLGLYYAKIYFRLKLLCLIELNLLIYGIDWSAVFFISHFFLFSLFLYFKRRSLPNTLENCIRTGLGSVKECLWLLMRSLNKV